jgi:PAS domain S-box-containing protein
MAGEPPEPSGAAPAAAPPGVDVRIARLQGLWTALSAALIALLGVAVLAGGWGLGLEPLRRVAPGLAAMRPVTALSLVLAGFALWLLRDEPAGRRRRALAQGLAGAVTLVGALGVVDYLSGFRLLPERLVAEDPVPTGAPGGMPPLTAVALLMAGLALIGLGRPALFRVGQILAVATGFLGFLNVISYAYSVASPRLAAGPRLASYTGMALHAAAALVLLGVAITTARPGRGAGGIFARTTAGGAVARWLLPLSLFGPFVLGTIQLAGQWRGYYGPELGQAIATAATIVVFSVLVWWTAVRLHRTDVRRRRAEAELLRANQELEARVEARTAALAASEARYRRLVEDSVQAIIIHQDGVIRLGNPAAARLLGFADPAEMVGRPVMALVAPEHRDDVMRRVQARLRGEAGSPTVEVDLVRLDGARVPAEMVATRVEWAGAPALLVAAIDIGERRQRELAEQQAAALRSVTQLANGVAHEINNPLTVISGNLELMAAKLRDRPEVQANLERARTAARRVADMVNRMTRITRVETLDQPAGGAPLLDLRRSSEPVAPPDPDGG